jgi:hypothetical protein
MRTTSARHTGCEKRKMRKFKYPINEDTLVRLKLIIEAPLADLRKATTTLQKMKIRTGQARELRDSFESVVNVKLADELASFLRGMRQNMDMHDFSSEEVINAVQAGLEEFSNEPATVAGWNERSGILQEMLNSEPIHLSVKISKLMTQQDTHLHGLSIVSEILPLFDEKRDKLIGSIIKNTLTLTISDRNENEKIIEIPIGEEDIKRLVRQSEISLRKTELLRKELSTNDRSVIIYRAHP